MIIGNLSLCKTPEVVSQAILFVIWSYRLITREKQPHICMEFLAKVNARPRTNSGHKLEISPKQELAWAMGTNTEADHARELFYLAS